MSNKFNATINKEDKKLDKAIDLLMKDLSEALIYNKLIKDIIIEVTDNKKILNESNTFWFLTIQALKDARMIRLCRIFDEDNITISMINLLEAVKGNANLFSNDNFQNRLKDNPFIESLSAQDRQIDVIKLEEEIKKINENETIKKIFFLRNNFIAHKNLKIGLEGFNQLKSSHLEIDEIDEIDEILNFAFDTINSYNYLFKATTWSKTIIGHDDFKGLINFFNIGFEKYKEDIENEIAKYKNNS